MKKGRSFILVFLFFIFYTFPIKPMNDFDSEIIQAQPQSLQEICAQTICKSLCDIQSYDLEAEEKKLKDTLEKIPENWQQKIIEAIHMRTIPEWTKTGLGWTKTGLYKYMTGEASSLSITKKLAIYKTNNEVHIRDLESYPQMHYSFSHHNIRSICKAPHASLMAVRSKKSVTLYSCTLPFKRIIKIPIKCKQMAFSYDKEPKLFVTDVHNKLTIYSNVESKDYIFHQYNLPEDIEVKYLKASPDNSYLIATSKFIDQPSYIITLEPNICSFKPIYQPIYNPIISSDGSFLAAQLYNEEEKSFVFKRSGQSFVVDGELITIKNNYIFTSQKHNDETSYKIFNAHGALQNSLNVSRLENPLDFGNLFSELYTLKDATLHDTKNIIFKIAYIKAQRKEDLHALYALSKCNTFYTDVIIEAIEDIKKRKSDIIKAFKEKRLLVKTMQPEKFDTTRASSFISRLNDNQKNNI